MATIVPLSTYIIPQDRSVAFNGDIKYWQVAQAISVIATIILLSVAFAEPVKPDNITNALVITGIITGVGCVCCAFRVKTLKLRSMTVKAQELRVRIESLNSIIAHLEQKIEESIIAVRPMPDIRFAISHERDSGDTDPAMPRYIESL